MELKFRMYNKLRNLMVYSNEAPSLSQFFMGYELGIANKLPIELMQFTGLTDKNGVEIYEGDIISVPYITPVGDLTEDENYRTVVEFTNGSFTFKGYSGETIAPLSNFCKAIAENYVPNVGSVTTYSDETYLTVIGNIHENENLLSL